MDATNQSLISLLPIKPSLKKAKNLKKMRTWNVLLRKQPGNKPIPQNKDVKQYAQGQTCSEVGLRID
jgi:hypothetical protein